MTLKVLLHMALVDIARCMAAKAALRFRETGYFDDCEPGDYQVVELRFVCHFSAHIPSTEVWK